MTRAMQLRVLAAGGGGAPFDFDEFERRRDRRRHTSQAARWSAAAVLGVVVAVPLAAVLTQGEPATTLLPAASVATPVPTAPFSQAPALIDMERFAVTSEIEDHIALLDDEISAARLRPVSQEDIRQMERARRELDESLRGVAQAHALLDL